MRMAELDTPVVRGLGMANNGKNYATCAARPILSGDGRWQTENVILSPIMENVSVTRCLEGNCPAPGVLSLWLLASTPAWNQATNPHCESCQNQRWR